MNKNIVENNELKQVSGGQISIDDVMGVEGLWMCTGAPTQHNPEGVFWKYHGISLTKLEAIDMLKKKSTRYLNIDSPAEAFLDNYIKEYNDIIDGQPICYDCN